MQERIEDGFKYIIDGKEFFSIYEVELYVDPKCVQSMKKSDVEKRRKKK